MKRSRIEWTKRPVPLEIKQHWTRVAALGCIITESMNPTIHHCHGGSVIERLSKRGSPGMAQKQSDWLVIPLAAELHTGLAGIDSGMGFFKTILEWEGFFGAQADFLDEVGQRLGYSLWEKAGYEPATCVD